MAKEKTERFAAAKLAFENAIEAAIQEMANVGASALKVGDDDMLLRSAGVLQTLRTIADDGLTEPDNGKNSDGE